MSSGTGIFDPSIDAGGTYTYTVTNSCGPSTADVVVTVTSNPDPGTNGALTLCSNGAATDLFNQLGGTPDAGGVWTPALSSGTGLFDPTLDAAGTYTYSLNACGGGTVTADVVVTVNALPSVSAGSDQTICDGSSVTLSGSGAVSYTWDNGVTDGVAFTPSVGTVTYTVTGTDANSCVNTDQVDVTVNALPSVSAGSDQTICDGSSVTLSGSGAVSYTWDNGVTDGVAFTPSVGTVTYTVTGADANSCVNTDQVDVTVNPLANAGTNGALTLCSTDPSTDLFNQLGGTPDAGGLWSPALSSGTGIFDPSIDAGGTYTYTVTNSCGPSTADVVVTVTSNPDPGTNGALTLCSNGSATDLFNQLGGTPDAGGVWTPALSSGTGLFDPTLDAAGTYTYSLNACGGGTVTADVVVTVNALPSVSAGSDQTICDGSSVTLSGSGAVSYTWDNGVTDGVAFSPSVGTVTYTVTGTDANSCVNTDQVDVTVNPLANAGTNGALTLCSTDPSTDLFNQLGGTPDAGGVWSPALSSGTGIFDPSIDAGGTYTYTVTNSCGPSTADVVVTVTSNPDPGTNGALTLCSNGAATDLFNQLGGTPDAGGVWTPALSSGTGLFDPTLDAAGTYTYSLNACGGGTVTADVQVILNNTSFNSISVEICQGDSLLIGSSYQSITGTYIETLTGVNSCDSILEINLNVIPSLDPTIISDSVFCDNETPLNLLSVDAGGVWSGLGIINPNTGEFDPNLATAGTHPVSYTVGLGSVCENADTVNIVVNESPVALFSIVDDSCQLSIGSIGLSISGGELPYVINWSNGSIAESINELSQGEYWVEVMDNKNCYFTDTVFLEDDLSNCSGDLWVPNVFSPNNDFLNDVLFVRGATTALNFNFMVFNRWGEVIFETDDPYSGWDGTFRNKPMNNGVYVYMVKATLLNGEDVSLNGTITLIK